MIKNKTNRFGRSMRYVPNWTWPKCTQAFIESTVKEHPVLHAGSGASTFGDVRIDRFKIDNFYPLDARADWHALPVKDDAFGCVLMDPPWKVCAMQEIATAFREALRVAPVLYVYAPYLWGARGVRVTDSWVRLHLGVHHPVMLVRYERTNEWQMSQSVSNRDKGA